MIKIDKQKYLQLRTSNGGYSGALVSYVKKITNCKKFKSGLIGFLATDEQWKKMQELSNYTKNCGVISNKKRRKIINSISKPDGWNWKPPQPAPVKRESKNHKNQGRKVAKRQYVCGLDNKDFYLGDEWRMLRVRVLEKYECKCMMCGRSPQKHGIVIHVDHIKPRSRYPELSLEFTNLQLLCDDCNIGKSNKYATDWRPDGNEDDWQILENLPVTMQ